MDPEFFNIQSDFSLFEMGSLAKTVENDRSVCSIGLIPLTSKLTIVWLKQENIKLLEQPS